MQLKIQELDLYLSVSFFVIAMKDFLLESRYSSLLHWMQYNPPKNKQTKK